MTTSSTTLDEPNKKIESIDPNIDYINKIEVIKYTNEKTNTMSGINFVLVLRIIFVVFYQQTETNILSATHTRLIIIYCMCITANILLLLGKRSISYNLIRGLNSSKYPAEYCYITNYILMLLAMFFISASLGMSKNEITTSNEIKNAYTEHLMVLILVLGNMNVSNLIDDKAAKWVEMANVKKSKKEM